MPVRVEEVTEMPTLAIVSFVAAACVCCALCGYGIATAVRRHRERRDRLMHVVSFHKGASQRGDGRVSGLGVTPGDGTTA